MKYNKYIFHFINNNKHCVKILTYNSLKKIYFLKLSVKRTNVSKIRRVYFTFECL